PDERTLADAVNDAAPAPVAAPTPAPVVAAPAPVVAAPPPLPAAPAGTAPEVPSWDPVQAESAAPAADETPAFPEAAVAEFAAPERESLELPPLEFELPPVTVQPPALPPQPVAEAFHYDPASGEYVAIPAAPSGSGTASFEPTSFEPASFESPVVDEAPQPPALPPEMPAPEAPAVEAAQEPEAATPPAAVPPPLPEAPVAAQPPAIPAEHNQWLGLTVHIRPRTPAEPVAAQPPVLPPVSEPEATPESAPEAPAEVAHAVPESIQAPAVEAPAVEEAPVEPSVLDEVAAAAASLPAAACAAAPVAPAAPVAGPPSEPLAAPVPGATAGGFDENQDIDADIREVFLEEFEEERANLARLLPMWLRSPDDMERLRPIRRVFHTLKGSGRLVGASALGEFAWKIESMLNRVLDGTRPASPAVTSMVQQAATVLPQFDAALRGEGTLDLDLRAMEAVAERIAAGEEAFHTLAPVAAAVAPVAEAAPVE